MKNQIVFKLFLLIVGCFWASVSFAQRQIQVDQSKLDPVIKSITGEYKGTGSGQVQDQKHDTTTDFQGKIEFKVSRVGTSNEVQVEVYPKTGILGNFSAFIVKGLLYTPQFTKYKGTLTSQGSVYTVEAEFNPTAGTMAGKITYTRDGSNGTVKGITTLNFTANK